MKKFISILLSLCLIFTMASPVMAAEISVAPSSSVVELDDGYMYTAVTNSKKVAILTNNDGSLVDISISYLSSPNTVYQWSFESYAAPVFTTSNSFWNGIIDYAESQMNSASVVTFTDVIYDTPIDITLTRSSASEDLKEEMVELLGTDEYAMRLIHTVDYGYMHMDIYETLDIRIFTAGVRSWDTTITVSSLIVGVLGLAAYNYTFLAALCGALGVSMSIHSLVTAGSIDQYLCRGMYFRDVTINDSSYSYAMADRYIDYTGYDDPGPSDTRRAFIDSNSYAATYIPDRGTYFSYANLVAAAYEEYLRIGQQD